MASIANHWKQRAEATFAPLHAIDRSWFPDAFRNHAKLMNAAALSTTARRLLYSYLPTAESVAVQGEVSVPGWAQLDAMNLRRLVLRLGAFACATPLSRTIEQSDLVAIRSAIDIETYRDAVEQPNALIENDIGAEFGAALERDELRYFIAAIGMSVLQCVAPQDKAFILHRLRYHFPRKAWSQLRTDLICHAERVIEILIQDGNV